MLSLTTSARMLADQSSAVIKIERRDPLDLGSRRGGFTGNLFRGKQSTVINMADARGREIARQLVTLSDVVIDNFSADARRPELCGYQNRASRSTRPGQPPRRIHRQPLPRQTKHGHQY